MSLRRQEISTKDRKEISHYVEYLARNMHLRDWKTYISDQDVEDKEALAEVKVTFGQKALSIRLGASFLRQTPKRQRDVLVHELCHVHTDALDVLLNGLETPLGPSTFALLSHASHERDELMVDTFALLIAPRFPTMAEWRKKGRK